MSKFFKRVACIIAAGVAALSIGVASACAGSDGINGRDGSDLNIRDIYNEYVTECEDSGQEALSFLDFLEAYLGNTAEDVQDAASLQSVINYSLLSSVSVLSTYTIDGSKSSYVGSGVIVDINEDGDAYIVTNAHIVLKTESSERYCNTLNIFLYGNDVAGVDFSVSSGVVSNVNGISGRHIDVIGCSATYDIAVLKVTGSSLLAERYSSGMAVAATFSEEDEVFVGQSVYAVGNPSGEGLSVTTGVISRDSETIYLEVDETERDYRVMRTDAAVNGGNSGGGLFNSEGKIIGIVNSKSDEDGTDNMGYALPSSYVRRIVQSMIDSYEESGTASMNVQKALLGITTTVADTDLGYDASGNVRILQTIRVSSVESNHAASKILMEGDVIRSFSIGRLTSGSEGYYAEPLESFSVPDEEFTVARHYFSADLTRSYMLTDAMFAARAGDCIELVIERAAHTYYVYIQIDSSDFTRYC